MANKNLDATLQRLAKMNQQNAKPSGGTSGANKFFKPKEGKNNLLVLKSPLTGDPFLEWAGHKNLLEVAYHDVNCDKFNFGKECAICEMVDALKKQNWKGNFPIWKPIELKIRYFSPIVDLDDLDAGIQWWSYGKSVLTQFQTWLLNLEEGETEFYDAENPEKIIVNYNKSAAPAEMYKLDKKLLKPFGKVQNDEWAEQIKPLTEVLTSNRTQEEVVAILEDYLKKMQDTVDATDAPEEAEPAEITPTRTVTPAPTAKPAATRSSRLDSLKG